MSQGWGAGGYGPPPGPGGYGPPPTYGQGYGAPMPMQQAQQGPVVPTCRLCGAPTAIHSKVSTGGWVLFVVLLICCFPFCFLGLLIREHGQRCTRCFAMNGGMS